MKISVPDGHSVRVLDADEVLSTRVTLIARVGDKIVWSDGPRWDWDEYESEAHARTAFADAIARESEGILDELRDREMTAHG